MGNVKENTYTLKTSTEEWSVSYTQLPKIATSLESNKALYSKAKQGFIKDTGAQELSFEKINLQEKEGRELVFKIAAQNDQSAKMGKARFFISNQKIYVIVGTSSKENAESNGIEKYLNSFLLLSPKK